MTIILALILAIAIPVPRAAEMGVTVWEDAGAPNAGDSWTLVSTTPTAPKVSDLSTKTNGLHDGCNTSLGVKRSTWNDCISAVSYSGMPSGYRLVLYNNAGYLYRHACWDADGSRAYNVIGWANDYTSSWRVEGGNC